MLRPSHRFSSKFFMKNFLFLFLLFPFTAWAYKVADVPNVRLTDATQYVSDPDELISSAAKDTINVLLAQLEQSTGIETAVVMLPTIDDADEFDFSVELFRSWGIGKEKSNNGLLILYVSDIRVIRFTTGYGVEGTMTDAMAKRIQNRYMIPYFMSDQISEGMVAGVRAACQLLDGTMVPEEVEEDDFPWWLMFFFVGCGILMMVVVGYYDRKKRTCPNCHLVGLKEMSSTRYKDKKGNLREKKILICRHCGHVVERDENIMDDDDLNGLNAIATGTILGSALRGGRGGFGGGSFGGSFGGGSTGGGGASSHW